ncbi:unnamed protein product [Lactuca virosa]|uniref:Uncharacterized protein n=1 Tax=Lactuca virosa TaxID=75947 RepID=A0AAU9P6V6_9ASTR|nr:unnamed protein product [Lactuca virosa]
MPWTSDLVSTLVRSWIIIGDDIVVTDLPYLMYGSLWVRFKNMFHYKLSRREYRIEEEVKSKFKDIRSKIIEETPSGKDLKTTSHCDRFGVRNYLGVTQGLETLDDLLLNPR